MAVVGVVEWGTILPLQGLAHNSRHPQTHLGVEVVVELVLVPAVVVAGVHFSVGF